MFGDGHDLAVRAARGDHHVVGEGGLALEVDDDDVLGLVFFQRVAGEGEQGIGGLAPVGKLAGPRRGISIGDGRSFRLGPAHAGLSRSHGADGRGRMTVQPARDKAPGRRFARGEAALLPRRQPVTREGARGRRGQRGIAPAGTGEGGDRDFGEQLAPSQPMLELGQDIGAHQPDELGARIAPAQRPHGVERIARAEQQFGRVDPDAGVAGELTRARDASRQRLHAVVALQWVLRRDEPPDLVETEAPQGFQADVAMAVVGRVERSAQKADAARRIARDARHRMARRGHAIDLMGAGCLCRARCSCRW